MKKYKYRLSRSKERFSRMYKADQDTPADTFEFLANQIVSNHPLSLHDVVNYVTEIGTPSDFDINYQDVETGYTLLMIASMLDREDIVEVLLEGRLNQPQTKANKELVSREGKTALMYAIDNRNIQVSLILVYARAQIDDESFEILNRILFIANNCYRRARFNLNSLR